MSLFGALVRTVVNVVALPVKVAADVVMAPADAGSGQNVGHRTSEQVQKIKDEADDDE